MAYVKETDILNMNDLQLILKYIQQKKDQKPNLLTAVQDKNLNSFNRRISFREPEINISAQQLPLKKIITNRNKIDLYVFIINFRRGTNNKKD
jgi:hypothetical protein